MATETGEAKKTKPTEAEGSETKKTEVVKKSKVESSIQTWKKKNWYPIISEKLFENNVLGETPLEEWKKVSGRIINVNMMTITGEMKRQHINIIYKITNFKDKKLYATPMGYKISSAYLKRIVRRGRNRIDDSFLVKTIDNKVMRIKTIAVTRTLTKRSLRSKLKRILVYETAELAKTVDFFRFLEEVLRYRYQLTIGGMLNKIRPIKQVEVKLLELVDIDPKLVPNYSFKDIRELQEKYRKPREERQEERPRVHEQKTEAKESNTESVAEPTAKKEVPVQE
ncbi:hypothetical protein J4434_07155 [Candidatus Woesearchaeota archaeon]|nr:hypothetical protein [Candidatus Woesearchaeota archaeon]